MTPIMSSPAPKLTIGMATFDDFDGVYMTVQAMQMFHAEALRDCELIVVDNNPGSNQGKRTRSLIEGWVRNTGIFGFGAKYIVLPSLNSTSRPRQMIFEHAVGKMVLVCDPHVLFPLLKNPDGSTVSPFTKLIEWSEKNPEAYNILHGPMVYDDFKGFASHMEDIFRGEMRGTWATDERGKPDIDGIPFEIPAHGMGMWACRREAWLAVGGFHPLQRGFGGEEVYIHDKFRKFGREHNLDCRTLCAPFLPWMHRFNAGTAIKYPLHRVDKLRNYILEYRELGEPLDRVYNHFVLGKCEDGTLNDYVVTQAQWDSILEDPTIYPVRIVGDHGVVKNPEFFHEQERRQEIVLHEKPPAPPAFVPQKVLERVFTRLSHGPFFTVVYPDYPSDRVSIDGAKEVAKLPDPEAIRKAGTPLINVILHNATTAQDLLGPLRAAAEISSRYLTVTNINAFGEHGRPRVLTDGTKFGNPGLFPAVRQFLGENPEWTVIDIMTDDVGCLILSKHVDDKPPLPATLQMAANYSAALISHAAANLAGGDNVTSETYKTRLAICSLCPMRTGDKGDRCSLCGCVLLDKAGWQSSSCPVGKWDDPNHQRFGSLEIITVENTKETSTTPPHPKPCCGR